MENTDDVHGGVRIFLVLKLDDGVSWSRGGRSVIDLMLEIGGDGAGEAVADLENAEKLQGVAVGIKVSVDRIPSPVSQSLRREEVQFPRNCAKRDKIKVFRP